MIRSSMVVWRRELGLRVRPVRKSDMRRLSYEWLVGLREIVIDPVRCPIAYEEFRLERDRDGSWVDEILDENDHSIDAVRYAVMDGVQCKAWFRRPSRLQWSWCVILTLYYCSQ